MLWISFWRHHLSVGANYIYNQLNENNVLPGNGYWTFNGQASGDGIVDFLLGLPNTYEQGNPSMGNPRQDCVGVYAQDDFSGEERIPIVLWLNSAHAKRTFAARDGKRIPSLFGADTVSVLIYTPGSNGPPSRRMCMRNSSRSRRSRRRTRAASRSANATIPATMTTPYSTAPNCGMETTTIICLK